MADDQFETGKKEQNKTDDSYNPGTFHRLPIKVQDSLLLMCKKISPHAMKYIKFGGCFGSVVCNFQPETVKN
jgi:hypothetical protein